MNIYIYSIFILKFLYLISIIFHFKIYWHYSELITLIAIDSPVGLKITKRSNVIFCPFGSLTMICINGAGSSMLFGTIFLYLSLKDCRIAAIPLFILSSENSKHGSLE